MSHSRLPFRTRTPTQHALPAPSPPSTRTRVASRQAMATISRRRAASSFLAGCFLSFLCLAALPTIVRGDASAASNDPAELIVPTGHGTQFDKADELQNQLQQKVAALFTAEKAILSLQDQLNAASTQLQANAAALTASDKATTSLKQQINDLTSKLSSAEATATSATTAAAGAAKEEIAALTAKLQKAEEEAKKAREGGRKLEEEVEGLKKALAEGAKEGEEKQQLQAQISTLTKERDAAVAAVEAEKTKAAAALSKAKEEAAVAVAQEQEKAAAAVEKTQQELTNTLNAEKKRAEAEVKKIQKEAAAAAARLNVLETQVANADRKLAEAKEGWSEKMKKKEKEVGELQAKLTHALETKYSAKVLWADFAAWATGVGKMIKEQTQKGVEWTVKEGRKRGKDAQIALTPHVETAKERARELHREASKVCVPLVETHVLPPYHQHVHPILEKTKAIVLPIWNKEVHPRLILGGEIAGKYAKKGLAIAKTELRKAKKAMVVWVGKQEWRQGRDAEGLVDGALYFLSALLLFLTRYLIWGALVWVGGMVVWLVKLPFVIVFWFFFWPFYLLFGWGKKKEEGGEGGAAAATGGAGQRRGGGGGAGGKRGGGRA